MPLGLLANVSPLDDQMSPLRGQSAFNASFTKVAETGRVNLTAGSGPADGTGSQTKAKLRPYLIAERNALDAISMVSVANGALGELSDQLGHMRALVEAGASDSLSPADISRFQRGYSEAQSQLDQIKQSTRHNGVDLLSSKAQPVRFQVGLPGSSNNQLQVDFSEFNWSPPPVTSVGTSNSVSKEAALRSIDDAIRQVSSRRANLEAVTS